MIRINTEQCCYCGGCVSVCPVGAISLAETRLGIDDGCIACGDCVAACPVGALVLSKAEQSRHVPLGVGTRYDLIVVGAGPAGSMAALTAARAGLSVLMLEKRQEIGSPVRCAEGVPAASLSELVEPQPQWISARVRQAQIVARAAGETVAEWRGAGGLGYVLERRVFDRALAEQAAQAGADVRVKATVRGLLLDGAAARGVEAEWHGRRYHVQSEVVIGADGVEAQTGSWAGLSTHVSLADMMVCAQFLLSGVDWDPTCLGYWIDERVAPGGYAWVFPKGEGRANVGLGVQADLAEATALAYLNRFVESEPCLAAGSPVTLVAGNVPVAPPCERLVTEGLMLVGDAGRLVDPLTGGGIIHAMFAGRMAAQVAIEAIDERDRSAARLADYEAQLQVKLGRSLARRQHVRQEFSPSERASRRFVRIFALAAGGQ